jgi:hypothetical protein
MASLSHKLSSSSSVRSLLSEEHISEILRRQRWTCHQGPFYRDPIEGKLRELDVFASQTWQRGRGRKREVAHLNLVIEAKSAKDWHLVFAGQIAGSDFEHRVWSGFLGPRHEWLRDALRRVGLPEEGIASLVRRFEARAFPNGIASLSPMFADAPPANLSVTAFRETNTDKEKELDNSVFWRAVSGLRSATTAMEQWRRGWHAEIFEVDQQDEDLQFLTPKSTFFDRKCDQSLGFVDILHPIVVIDSQLWMLRRSRLQQVPWCRFVQVSPIGSSEWWCDVVHSEEFESYARIISDYYSSFFRGRHARRSP